MTEDQELIAWYEHRCDEKDAEIVRLTADNQRLREALECLVECVEMRGFGKAYAMDISKQALAATEHSTVTMSYNEKTGSVEARTADRLVYSKLLSDFLDGKGCWVNVAEHGGKGESK